MAPLIALGISILPTLARLLIGERAGEVAGAVARVVQEVTGTDDPAAARAKLDADPAAASQLRVRLAEIALEGERLRRESEDRRRAAEMEAFRARLSDVQGARGAMVRMAGQGGSLLAWGPAMVSAIVTTGFFGMLGLFLFWTPPAEHQQAYALLNIAVGALVAGFTAVVNFWIGSSQGSREKDEVVRRFAASAAPPAAPPPSPPPAAPPPATDARAEAEPARIVPVAATPAPAEARFARSLALVLGYEGGFANDPQDPGGPTMMGITQATLSAWRGHTVTAEEVRELTAEEAREIYRAEYWNRLRCDDLPAGLDLVAFDCGVNAGPGTAARLLQRTLAVREDGAVGPITLAAARAAEPRAAIDRLSRLREEHYRGLPGFPRFGRGWLRRTEAVRRAAQDMVAAPVTA